MEEKKAIRNQLKQQLGQIQRPMYEHLSYKIAQKLYNSPVWTEAKIVGLTISKMPEVDTYQIIRKAWEQGKTVVVPKCYPNDKAMKFRVLKAFEELESVYYGLYEPIEDVTEEICKSDIDLIIVPGIAFNREGYRIGFGGGYYDRYLADYKGVAISLAFNTQIVQTLPIEGHDIPVSKIFTDEETIEIYG
ncbi:5-formyltetrahydrofolate cyclo-ligase [Robertmurraya andreesenii]|uniref:5-formyltetrahydrofolate cyclo-ligase n=1 Tax=Anoxybacillus andreesenii TaxID=1325932 RepID=A0ABT9V603_9BACL|nr:5-formyltetrahydrofolate cyclo-ligase [Robertmurraya andreesenii]MDQ0156384.1 5-formyltetrahydrofolate cyclo-ligase [Robertmurraya andreesenii]